MSIATQLEETKVFQNLLTCYVDSRDGYRQAADLILDAGLAQTFEHIASRRHTIAEMLGALIRKAGEHPNASGSRDAGAHRWWTRIRGSLAICDSSVLLRDCLRSERELARSLQAALDSGMLTTRQSSLFADAHAEVEAAIQAFDGMVVHSESSLFAAGFRLSRCGIKKTKQAVEMS